MVPGGELHHQAEGVCHHRGAREDQDHQQRLQHRLGDQGRPQEGQLQVQGQGRELQRPRRGVGGAGGAGPARQARGAPRGLQHHRRGLQTALETSK